MRSLTVVSEGEGFDGRAITSLEASDFPERHLRRFFQ